MRPPGFHHTNETKAKMSAANKGRPSWAKGKPLSEKHKRKIGKANLGKHHSDESRRKMREAHLGKPRSEETKQKIREALLGAKNHNWRGGISHNPYSPGFTTNLKQRIRKRTNHSCQLCGIKQTSPKLSVHHIDYNKNNNAPDNLVALCPNCHVKTNFNRKKWKAYFRKDHTTIALQFELPATAN